MTTCCRGGEEILKYDRVLLNAGDGLNPDTGVFSCPAPGTYMFIIHIATHKDKVIQGYSVKIVHASCLQKALLSLRKNGLDIASIVNQDGKNKGNHMMGQCVLMELEQGDEVCANTVL